MIGPQLEPGAAEPPTAAGKQAARQSPLLQRPSWRIRLAFFPPDAESETPDYELGMRLLANGVSQDMSSTTATMS